MTKLVNICVSFDNSFFLLCLFLMITGGDMGRLRDSKGTGSGDSYRVLLIDDARHSENLGNLFA